VSPPSKSESYAAAARGICLCSLRKPPKRRNDDLATLGGVVIVDAPIREADPDPDWGHALRLGSAERSLMGVMISS
jgi:hypothetical protein